MMDSDLDDDIKEQASVNGPFIALARTWLPRLREEVERLQQGLDLKLCPDTMHKYFPLRKNWFKQNGETSGLGTPAFDHSITYTTLCCSSCGHVKEVVSADHRKEPFDA